MTKVLSSEFITTATSMDTVPRHPVPEAAFIGRSNVGKSSMINTLSRRKNLVRVSNTPGRTKALNFFDLHVEHGAKKRTVRFCDLPGYGFAKVSKAERAEWDRLINGYLANRHTLKLVVVIVDAEVGPTSDDLEMLDYLQDKPPQILVVLTKMDRLGKAARTPKLHAVAKQLELPREAVLPFSSHEGIGHDEVWSTILKTLG